MEGMTVRRAAEICGGKLCNSTQADTEIRQIVIDSREVKSGDLFVAYRGERVDGHNYVSAAFRNGASCCLVERIPQDAEGALILVEDVQAASEKIAAAYREQFDIPVVGITGSVGKTTAKEMIAAVLEQRFHTLKTEGNFNNRISIPMMLSRLDSSHEAAVIEMGISEFDEMRMLARMVQPTMAVYTVIGHAHLEFLQDLDGVLRAKTEMLETLPETAPVLVNGDDEKLRAFSCRQRKILFGFSEDCHVRPENLCFSGENTACDIVCGLRRIPVTIPSYGKHAVRAALAAAAVGMLLGLNDTEIAQGIAAFHNVSRRGEIQRTSCLTLIDDSYNANPDSVSCGIDSLLQLPGKRHVCILGDMLELGEDSAEMHAGIGRYAAEKGVDLLLTSGGFSWDFCRGAGKIAKRFDSREGLIQALPLQLREGDCVLVKASKASHYETIAAAIRELSIDCRPIILFDLDDTILDFKKAEERALSRSLEELGLPVSSEILQRYSVVNLEHWERLERREITRQQVLKGRFEQLFSEYGIQADPDAMQSRYENNLSEGHFFVAGAQELLKELQGKYRLFLVSNGTASVQEGRLKSAGISRYFEQIFISENLGVNKPSAEYFEACFQRIPYFDRSRTLIVGDSLTSDILGGKNAGIRTCWFNLRNRPEREDILPDEKICSLMDLPPLLERLFPTD